MFLLCHRRNEAEMVTTATTAAAAVSATMTAVVRYVNTDTASLWGVVFHDWYMFN
jgi:hypothetical protein